MGAIGVIHFQLPQESIRRREEMHSHPREPAAVPTVSEERRDHIAAVPQEIAHVVDLVEHALAIVGEVWGHDIGAHALAIEEDSIAAESCHIEPGTADAFCDREHTPEICGRLRQRAGIAQSLVLQVCNNFGLLPVGASLGFSHPVLIRWKAQDGAVPGSDFYQRR